ncbi:hypothetical protein V8C42DRAFT_315135 [Trichoderma barbatum]
MKSTKGNRAIDTCEWIFEIEQLATWIGTGYTIKEDRNSHVLWLYQDPVPANRQWLDDLLARKFSTTHDKSLAFFFCNSGFGNRKIAI